MSFIGGSKSRTPRKRRRPSRRRPSRRSRIVTTMNSLDRFATLPLKAVGLKKPTSRVLYKFGLRSGGKRRRKSHKKCRTKRHRHHRRSHRRSYRRSHRRSRRRSHRR